VDGWAFGGNFATRMVARRAGAAIDVRDPQTIEERRQVADRCETMLGYGYPTYVDDVDDEVSKAFAAKPTRLYLLDEGGRVVYRGGLGPWGFRPADLERAIEQHLAAD
jgi:hypothetical protein